MKDPASDAAATPRVVAIGGGTGLPVVLSGLRRRLADAEKDSERLTAVVSVADDGGSTGRLRRAYDVLAPGDVRNCLLALADRGRMRRLFGFRFPGAGDVAGHNLGNLILTALSIVHSDFSQAVDGAAQMLGVSGRVLAATDAPVRLVGELEDGSHVRGEAAIGRTRRRLRRLRLEPRAARLLPSAREALRRAELVVIGPGSLYTSLLPPLLLRELPRAIAESGARVVLVMNLMTQPESAGLGAAAHVRALRAHVPELPIHDVLVNDEPLPGRALVRAASLGCAPVACDDAAVWGLGCRPVRRPLLAPGRSVRHDPRRLADALLDLAQEPAKSGAAESLIALRA
jgi:uncharacterized cofD-like protein